VGALSTVNSVRSNNRLRKLPISKWWKCDLQVATPAWQFSPPEGLPYDVSTTDGKRTFAQSYVEAMKAKGIEVMALADHNTGE
jgi:hypothetical protein